MDDNQCRVSRRRVQRPEVRANDTRDGTVDDNQSRVVRRRVQRPQARANDTRNGTVDEYQAAFGAAEEVEMTPRMQALDERIQIEVREEARFHEAE
jgi:hypothetical protein